MLDRALRTNIPLLGVRTDDPINAFKVIASMTHKPLTPSAGAASSSLSSTSKQPEDSIIAQLIAKGGSVTVIHPDSQIKSWLTLHQSLQNKGLQAVVLNPPTEAAPYLFDCGWLEVPDQLILDFVFKHASDKNVKAIVSSLKGLNLKQVLDVSKLATQSGKFTAQSIQTIRRELYRDVRGLTLVDTSFSNEFYVPNEKIEEWLEVDGALFSASDILQPRGLMFSGPPGTGKTMGAKALAHVLEVPLYKLDFASMMTRWQGETEHTFIEALKTAEQLAPCVLLLDEVDKLFVQNSDSGSVSRCLSILLWWLQEHKAKVVTIMTSNQMQELPTELYRQGRIDSVIRFSTLTAAAAVGFVENLHVWWMKKLNLTFQLDYKVEGTEYTEASLVEGHSRWLKKRYIAMLKGVDNE